MATNLRSLGPSAMCRLLNSTALKEVLSPRQLDRHRALAGLRIQNGRGIDLVRYAAWLAQRRHLTQPEATARHPRVGGDSGGYDAFKESKRRRAAEVSASGRDIGPIPEVANPARKEAARYSFRAFCESYFPQTFRLAWSPDHLIVITQIEEAVLRGGLFAMALPRGSGKSSISEAACMWAESYGHRRCVVLIGSDEGHGGMMLDSIKTEWETNALLLEDFPEICYPIHRLDGIVNRCAGQLCCNQRTHIGWTSDQLVLPTIPDSEASGAILTVAGLTGGIRGMKFARPDGVKLRPDLIVIDDPQTDQSARSPSQCATRERILQGAVLGLAGPGVKLSGIMPCTVIRKGDLADNFLTREKHPEWTGTRMKMVYRFPTDEKRWEEYGRIRAEGMLAGDGGRAATEYYREHRTAMDEGAVVAWPERFNDDELSALQHAMNLKLRDAAAFASEYQNDPLDEEESRPDQLSADQIAAKINHVPRGVVPAGCDTLTMFVDVQGSLLYFVVCAWEPDFTGYVIDYGAWPEQDRAYFTLKDANPTLATDRKGSGLEEQIYAGLEALIAAKVDRDWEGEGRSLHRVKRCLIDANYQKDVINQFCRQSPLKAVLNPSHGRFVGASSIGLGDLQRREGDRIGLNWRSRPVAERSAVRYIAFDTNYWKSFAHARLAVGMGGRGCLSLFGDEGKRHRMLTEHLTAEYPVRVESRSRVVDEWKLRPGRPDNHLFDCLTGATVAASIERVELAETRGPEKRERKPISLDELKSRYRRA